MGIRELSELPELPDLSASEGVEKLQKAIDELQNAGEQEQLSLSEVTGKE